MTTKRVSQWIENLSRIYRTDREHRNLSRWIEEAVEIVSSRNLEISMDQEAVKILSRRKPEISMDRKVVKKVESIGKFLDGLRICQGFIEK